MTHEDLWNEPDLANPATQRAAQDATERITAAQWAAALLLAAHAAAPVQDLMRDA